MAELLNNVKYSSSSTGSPFAITLESGFLAAPNNTRAFFYIQQVSNKAVYAEVEATVTGGDTLTVNFVHESSSTDTSTPSGYTLPTFSGSLEIYSAYPASLESLKGSTGKDGILIIGQSNAVGYNGPDVDTGLSGYNPYLHFPDANILQLAKSSSFIDPLDSTDYQGTTTARGTFTDADLVDKYVLAYEPLQHTQHAAQGGPEKSAGFGLEFAKIYRRETHGARTVVLLPGARGGTAFTSGGTGLVWNSPNGGLYTNALSLINEFLAENSDNRIVAILWHQGESNAATDPTTYEGYLDTMIGDLRTNATGNTRQPNLDGVPFVIGGLSKTWIANGGANRQAIDDSLEDTPNRVNYTGFADPEADYEVGTGIDDVHFGGIAHIRFARRYYEAWKSALTNLVGVSAPATPTGLNLTASDSQIAVSWNTVSGATSYTVEYKTTAAGSYTQRTPVGGTTDTITGLVNGTTYDVRVFATNAGGDSAPTAASQATPVADTVAPAPSNLAATAGDTEVDLTWDAVVHSPVVTGYNIQWRIDGSSDAYTDQAVSGQSTVAATVTGLVNGTSYEFRIASVNSVGTGSYSALVTETPAAPTTAPAPTGLAATPGNTQVSLSWNTVTHDPVVTGYRIRYRLNGGGAYTTKDVSGQATSSDIITGLTNDSLYDFGIASLNSVGEGTFSADITSTPTGSATPNTDALAPVVQLRRDAGVVDTTDAGRVEQWTDQTSNNNHFTQTVLANKPNYATNDITFTDSSGTGQWLTNSSANLDLSSYANGFTIIVRYHDMQDVFATRTIMQCDNVGPELRVDGFGKFQYSPVDSSSTADSVQDSASGEGELGTQIRGITHSTGGSPTMELQNLTTGTAVLEESQAYAYPTVHTEMRIGTSLEAPNLDAIDCIMRDFLVFDKVLTTTEMEQVVAEFEVI